MASKAKWVSTRTWRNLPCDLRAEIIKALGYGPVPAYACNIASALHDRGEHALAGRLHQELDAGQQDREAQ